MKFQFFILIFFLAFFAACSPSSPQQKTATANEGIDPWSIQEVSTDKTYGYTSENPINVGGLKAGSMVMKERAYLDILAGPNGEDITYYRLRSCCPFETENGMMGGGLLDVYIIDYGEKDTLYINMYDPGDLKIPNGLQQKDW